MFGHLGNGLVHRVIGAGAKDREVGTRIDVEVNYVDVWYELEFRHRRIPGPVWSFGPWECRLGGHSSLQRLKADQEGFAIDS
jgi:hypothetical protein